jgi:hypothetical protein
LASYVGLGGLAVFFSEVVTERFGLRDSLLEGPAAAGVSGLDYRKAGGGEGEKVRCEGLFLIEAHAAIFGVVAVIVDDKAVIPIVRDVDAELDFAESAEFRLGLSGEAESRSARATTCV